MGTGTQVRRPAHETIDVLVCYDVSTETVQGRRRLRLVAKACEAFGQRVQYSVFECSLSRTDLARLRIRLLEIVNAEEDSLRIYKLIGGRAAVTESYGKDRYIDFHDTIII